MNSDTGLGRELASSLPGVVITEQLTRDGIPTFWVTKENLIPVLRFLKEDAAPRYRMLFDLTAVDERMRVHREGQPPSDFTAVYHLLCLDPVREVRLKVALRGDTPVIPSITGLWP